ncbi:MAG: hypothetical protein IJS29_04560 [Selenomonadaceae bacterium]|nr:hypothetical protein [Selenomonadaceae bacterium]
MQIFFTLLLILIVAIFLAGTFRAYQMSKKSVALIEKYEDKKNNPQLIEEIFSAISKDFFLRRILTKHNATIDDIAKLHKKLLKWGDFRKYNRYVPITSFFNRTTLDYLLTHKDDDAKSLTTKMMNHFHF